MDYSRLPVWLTVVVGLCLSACTSQGPKKIPADRFNYNEAIANSWREQMLLNLVRLRYDHVPTFLTVGSVLTQYTYTGNLGAQGTVGTDRADSTSLFRGSIGLSYSERPTITFTPLTGDKFIRHLLNPIPVDIPFALGQAAWPAATTGAPLITVPAGP